MTESGALGSFEGGIAVPGRGIHVETGASRARDISIALDTAGRYDVLLMRGSEVVARRTLGPGASKHRGLAHYTLRVPPAVAEAGYDGLRIFPMDGRRDGRLGHVRLVPDAVH